MHHFNKCTCFTVALPIVNPFCKFNAKHYQINLNLQANEDELSARHGHLEDVLEAGDDLIKAGNFGADQIQQRTDDINQQWQNLLDLSAYRRKRLNEAVDFYQV